MGGEDEMRWCWEEGGVQWAVKPKEEENMVIERGKRENMLRLT